jgi:hypothetical protein
MLQVDDISKLIAQDEEIFNRTPEFEEEQQGDAIIVHPFDPTKIDIRSQPLIISSLIKRLDTNRLNLDTEFQRKGNLWDKRAQSRLIESLLVRIPLPAFYFDATDDVWLIVDGLQRISALDNFIRKKNFLLAGLEYLQEFEGKSWDGLPEHLQSRVEETSITAYIINPGTPPEVKFNIFKRINTGGLVLSPQEIRHALNQGPATKLVARLAALPEFRAAVPNVPSQRMEDRDYITRFLAFFQSWQTYKPDLESFLNKGLAIANSKSHDELLAIEGNFRRSMNAALAIFGKYAFRKKTATEDRRKPINKALFECVSVALASLSNDQIEILIKKKNEVDEAYIKLFTNDNMFYLSISSSTGDALSVDRRHKKIKELFKNILQ